MSNARTLSKLVSLSPLLSQVPTLVSIAETGGEHTGSVKDWAFSYLPDDSWIWCTGEVLLPDTPYTNLRTKLIDDNFPHGQDGSGNPKIPDARGRTTVGKDDMGGTAANRLTTAGSGIDGKTLGASGGAEVHTLTQTQMPAHSHTFTGNALPAHAHTTANITAPNGGFGFNNGTNASYQTLTSSAVSAGTPSGSNSSTGGGAAHNNTQPSLVLNKIIKT